VDTAVSTALGRATEALARRHRRLRADPEAGTSMVEIIVAMTIMVVCGAIFTGAMVSLFRANNAAQAVSSAAQQTNQAYQSLDRLVRYASAISTPAVNAGSWYVELSDTTTGSEVCTQLRLNSATGTLQRRSWTVTASTPTPTAWRAVASGLSNGSAGAGADQPFALVPPSGSVNRQRLAITLIGRAGPASGASSSRSSYTLTAVNSDVSQTPASVCQQVGRA